MQKGPLWVLCGIVCQTSAFTAAVFPHPAVEEEAQDTLVHIEGSGDHALLLSYEGESTAPKKAQKKIVLVDETGQETIYVKTAQTNPAPAAPLPRKKPVKELNSRLQVGGAYSYVKLAPHGSPSFHGNLWGVQGSYEYRPSNRVYGEVQALWREGSTFGIAGKRTLLSVDVQERLGYTFACNGDDWMFTFFSGFGYRYIGQHLSPKHGNALQFNYNEFYFPVGCVIDYAVNGWFCVGLNGAWMPQIYSTVAIVPLKGARWSLINPLNNFFVEMPFTFTLTKGKRFQLVINPFYEYLEDGHTTAKLSNGTPLGLHGNTYNFLGVDLNFAFRF